MSVFFRPRERRFGEDGSRLIPARVSSDGFAAAVTEQTAPQVLAYGSAVSLLASVVGMLPLDCYTGRGESQRPANRPSVLDDPGGQRFGLGDWLHQFVTSAAFTGNTVCVVRARDSSLGLGTPTVVEVVPVDRVDIRSTDRGRTYRVAGETIDPVNVAHFRRYPLAGHVWGRSPIAQYATTLGLALSSERFGRQWFVDGAHPSAVLESDQPINAEVARTVKERFVAALRGRREPFVAGSGLKYRPIQVAPNESQFLQTQEFTSAQCARILGPGLAEILGYPTGGSMTYSTREQAAIDLLTYTVDPWLVGIENFLTRLVGGNRWLRFNRGALLRTDLKTRYEAHRISLGPVEPWQTANEVRDLEDSQPVPWGDDRPAVQGDLTTGRTPTDA